MANRFLAAVCVGLCWGQLCTADVSLRHVSIEVRFVDYQFAVKQDANGLRRFDWELFRSRPQKVILEKWPGIELENEHLRVQLIPTMGRVHSFVNKHTGHEQLWINPCALPLGANNDTGFWMTWGGIERVLPRREHGTTHALQWSHELAADLPDRKQLRCSVLEPLTKIQLELAYSLHSDRKCLECEITVKNTSNKAQRFSCWTTATLAPGGKGEVTPKTELILPAAKFRPDERDFNDWMLSLPMAADRSPLRFVQNWKSIGDLMTSSLRHPYYAVYSHENDEGILHTFDLKTTPTVDIWGWGFPPTDARQKEYTAALPNRGYIEFWNGNTASFQDADLKLIDPGKQLRWVERTFAIDGLLHDNLELRSEIRTQAMQQQASNR